MFDSDPDVIDNPMTLRTGAPLAESTGSRQMQARENTEVMAMAVMAKRFPRDVIVACDRIKNAFTRPTLAEKAQYQFARGGTDIVGPSIRAAEAMAQQWGNMSNGWREISRSVGPDGVGVSEVEAFSVDYETVNREAIQFYVRHWRDTRSGGYKLKDERDIYELCANQAQRRKRACILAQIPGDVTEMAMDQAAVTLRAKADTSVEGIKKLLDAFAEFDVTREQIEKRIQRRLDSIQPAQVVGLKRVYASLRDEMSTVADWFEVEPEPPASTGVDAVRAAADAASRKRASTKKTDTPASTEGAKAEVGATPTVPYAQFADRLAKTKDKEIATLVLDEARDLPEAEYAELVKTFRAKFPDQS